MNLKDLLLRNDLSELYSVLKDPSHLFLNTLELDTECKDRVIEGFDKNSDKFVLLNLFNTVKVSNVDMDVLDSMIKASSIFVYGNNFLELALKYCQYNQVVSRCTTQIELGSTPEYLAGLFNSMGALILPPYPIRFKAGNTIIERMEIVGNNIPEDDVEPQVSRELMLKTLIVFFLKDVEYGFLEYSYHLSKLLSLNEDFYPTSLQKFVPEIRKVASDWETKIEFDFSNVIKL